MVGEGASGDGAVSDGVVVGSSVAVEVGTLDGPSPASGSSGVAITFGRKTFRGRESCADTPESTVL